MACADMSLVGVNMTHIISQDLAKFSFHLLSWAEEFSLGWVGRRAWPWVTEETRNTQNELIHNTWLRLFQRKANLLKLFESVAMKFNTPSVKRRGVFSSPSTWEIHTVQQRWHYEISKARSQKARRLPSFFGGCTVVSPEQPHQKSIYPVVTML